MQEKISAFFLFFKKTPKLKLLLALEKKLIILIQIFDFYSDLFHSVSIPKGNCSIFFTLLIDSDTVRSSDFILSSISFSNSSAIIVFAFAVLAQFLEEVFSNLYLIGIFFDERKDCKFYWCNLFWKVDNHARTSVFKLFFIIKFKHSYHYLFYLYIYSNLENKKNEIWSQILVSFGVRKIRDSNPRYGCPYTCTPNMRFRPLSQSSYEKISKNKKKSSDFSRNYLVI